MESVQFPFQIQRQILLLKNKGYLYFAACSFVSTELSSLSVKIRCLAMPIFHCSFQEAKILNSRNQAECYLLLVSFLCLDLESPLKLLFSLILILIDIEFYLVTSVFNEDASKQIRNKVIGQSKVKYNFLKYICFKCLRDETVFQSLFS